VEGGGTLKALAFVVIGAVWLPAPAQAATLTLDEPIK
jgi:hypothetical protein